MCGLTGYLGHGIWSSAEHGPNTLGRMADAIITRGPDDFGYWSDESAGIGLAHRRLSIVDLSPAGHQPMQSASGRYTIAFNGEIYNHLELRTELEQCGSSYYWRGHSDTETLLAGFDTWGVVATIERCVGMFAFALWDRDAKTLTLARDRLGEKPLYYGWQGTGENAVFVFGSELKALKAHPEFLSLVNRDSLCLLLRHNYIPAPYSIYQGIHKLLPGTVLTVSLSKREPVISNYWSLADTATTARTKQSYRNCPLQAVDDLESLLKTVIRQQMVADVPLGAFLSGGIDSSAVVALMQSQSAKAVKTFTIGFDEEGYNEAEHAKAVAQHLGTDHTEMYVSPQQAMAVIPMLPTLYDEPFSDSSQIPTFLVSQLARQHVTVSLSGDAGDELFCGYNRYLVASAMWKKLSALPLSLRKLIAQSITALSPKTWNRLGATLPSTFAGMNFGDRLHKGASVLGSTSVDALYMGLVSHWSDPAAIVLGGSEPATMLTGHAPHLTGFSSVERMMALDMLTYLPDDILAKVDRAAMGVSLETRVPFLDHRIVEFAWGLPFDVKLKDGVSKWALRQVLYRHVPQSLIDRPKMGFGIPLDRWLRGPLRDWAESLLDERRLLQEGYFRPALVRKKWEEHLSGQRNWAYHLWDVLMFQAWLEKN